MSDYGLVFVGGFISLIGLACSTHSEKIYTETRGIKSGGVVRGKIIHTAIEHDEDAETRTLSYRLVIRYQYSVDAKQYESTVLKRDYDKYGYFQNEADAQAVLSRYPIGAEVQVYYDPLHPGVSALELSEVTRAGTLFSVLLGIAIMIFGIWLVIGGLRNSDPS